MKASKVFVFFILLFSIIAKGQTASSFADSIKLQYNIPELAFAVVGPDTVFEAHVSGVQRMNTNYMAKTTDRFHIGSNTKAITSFIAAILVELGQIKLNTKFLDLFPELKPKSNKAYRNITLQDLLTFRGKLPAYTYTFKQPTKKQITGDNAKQRFLLAKYFLLQKPMEEQNGLTPSNADYILAGLMLEKASCKSYKKLVKDFGKTYGIDFGFDYPNLSDTLQPWGHDTALKPLPPSDNYKLNWLLSAGNINVSLDDYIKFIQLYLKAIAGTSTVLSKETANNLLFGLPVFSFGWFNKTDDNSKHHIAFNEGNAGAFITQVQVSKETNRAYIVFTNSATSHTEEGITILQHYLQKRYEK